MKLLRNIPKGYKLFRSVSVFNSYLDKIEAAKNAGDVEKEKAVIGEGVALWIQRLEELFDITFHIEGKENIPETGACVFISNHQGYADIIAILKMMDGKQVGFIAKDSLEKMPYFGKWIKAIRGVFIKRGDAREALKSIQAGVQTLKEGFSLVIFPEGTRSQSAEMGSFKPGSFKLATKAKVPVVPVALNGTRHLFEDRGVITNGAVIDVKILPAIDTASMDRHQLANISHEVEDTIREALAELIEKEKNRNKEEK